jgi:MoaA/NifB/PqqE/SkfB family radical SAM enzyme
VSDVTPDVTRVGARGGDWRAAVLRGIRAGVPEVGPSSVHIDVTNGCNAACVTCWDHSPLLHQPRAAEWKRRRLPFDRFQAIVATLAAMGSVRHVVLSGMGEPFTHPGIYDMIAEIKRQGWELTVITNLVAADPDRLEGVDQLLVGVQGVTPDSYTAFHPGWSEQHFFKMCRTLRRLSRTATRVRHVQVINRDTAPEVPAMVRFGASFGADRVNFKLAGLHDGTEACALTESQRAWLLEEGVPEAGRLAQELGVRTNLSLFASQLRAGGRATARIADIGCFMGYAFTRITVDEEVLFCCNVEVRVGSLRERPFEAWWYGPEWQSLRAEVAAGRYFTGCDQCGKLEQNAKWAERLATVRT